MRTCGSRTREASWTAAVLCRFFLTIIFACSSQAAELGDSVVLIYNSSSKDSKDIAHHYAERRAVPREQIIGLDLPDTENITRADYRKKFEQPLVKFLEEKKLFTFDAAKRLTAAKIRYAVLCYGVPLRILEDTSIIEPEATNLPPEIHRNGAAVDSELSFLPYHYQKLTLTGPLPNPLRLVTNEFFLNPVNGVLMVARLDGPTPAIARALVDKAMQAETNGLWGRAYFDLRGLTNGDYKMGDDWIRTAAEAAKRYGFDTITDEKEQTFSTNFPMSQIALYAGWYDINISGPFTQLPVEFMPGAIAYHLHSYSAQSLRTTNQHWCGPLLAAGATATMGCVDEPLLAGTPDVGYFFNALFHGFTFGEAASGAQQLLSWQTTVVGDPLYRPFGNQPRELHEKLIREKNSVVEWSHVRIVNLNLARGESLQQLAEYLEKEAMTKTSAVLLEKLGDLYQAQGKNEEAKKAWGKALKLNCTRQQWVRLQSELF